MPHNYNDLFLAFLKMYGFQPIDLHANFRQIFKDQVANLNPAISQKEILRLTNLIFHLDGDQLMNKRQYFRQLLESSIISSNHDQQVYLLHGQLDRNQLHYYVDENPTLGRACIMLFVNGLNLVSIHTHNTAPLAIVHRQYLHQLNSHPSLFEHTLFNALAAEGQLYISRIVKDLEHFNAVLDQPFLRFLPQQVDHFFRQSTTLPDSQVVQLTIDIQENEVMATAFKDVHLIFNQLWAILMVTYALKADDQAVSDY